MEVGVSPKNSANGGCFVILSSRIQPCANQTSKKDIAAYLVDLIALIRILLRTSVTYSELTQEVVQTLPVGHTRVDIVADTYRNDSIKNSERIKRGHSSKVVIKSAESRVH